jgi:hypothetical protein
MPTRSTFLGGFGSTPSNQRLQLTNREGLASAPRWDEVERALHKGLLPVLLAMQSACDGPLPDALVTASWQPQRLLLLPNHDSWLAPLQGTSCSEKRPTSVRLPSIQVAQWWPSG